MSIAIRYYTESHNTERLCKAAGDAIGVEALDVSVPLDEPVDQLILGSSPYKFAIPEQVKAFLEANKNKIGTIYLISAPALWESSMRYVKPYCESLGLRISDNDFHCYGEFLRFHKGKPDEKDLADCAAWAKNTFC